MKITICNHNQHFNSIFFVKKKKEKKETSQCVKIQNSYLKKLLKSHLQWKVRQFSESHHIQLCPTKNFMCCQEISNFVQILIFFLRICLKVGQRQREATHTNLHGRQARASVMQELSWLRGICVLGGGGVGLLIPIHL